MRRAHELITARRLALGISEVELAADCGIGIYAYGDIEQYRDELYEVAYIQDAKCLCDRLSLDIFDIFDMDCAFCADGAPYHDDYLLPRNELVRKKRLALGLSQDEVGDEIGFETIAVVNMENDLDFFEKWSFELVHNIALVLKVPDQVFLAIKCSECGR